MILVTGGTGLVGSHLLIHLLENKEHVRAIYRTQESILKTKALFDFYNKIALLEKIEWISADITDTPSLELAFKGCTQVYHCAALISFDPFDEKRLRKTNIEGTANIVNFCLTYSIEKLCYISSIAALGDLKPGETVITEETEWNPEQAHSDYAISKYGAEMELWRGQQEGLAIIVLNPGVILGPGFWHSGSGELFSLVAKGFPYFTRGTTGYVAVTDVVKIMYMLQNSDASGERYCLVAETFSYEKMTQLLSHVLHVKAPSIYIKPWLSNVLWRIDWLIGIVRRKRKLSKIMANSLHERNMYSSQKIQTKLSYKFEDMATYISALGKKFPKG